MEWGSTQGDPILQGVGRIKSGWPRFFRFQMSLAGPLSPISIALRLFYCSREHVVGYGLVAEWLRRGLQILAPRFDSGRGLQRLPGFPVPIPFHDMMIARTGFACS